MSVAVVIGAGKAAESITKLLLSSGTRVALVGAKPATLIDALKKDAESAIPFQFVDDIRHQEDHVRRRLARLSFHPSVAAIEKEVKIVFDAVEEDSASSEAIYETRKVHPRTPIASLDDRIALEDDRHIALHLYQPIECTKIAQIVHTPSTDAAALATLRSTLDKAGIHEVSAAEGVEASEALAAWNGADTGSLQNMVSNLFGVRFALTQDEIMH